MLTHCNRTIACDDGMVHQAIYEHGEGWYLACGEDAYLFGSYFGTNRRRRGATVQKDPQPVDCIGCLAEMP